LEKSLELAEILLDDPANWNGNVIRETIESRESRTVHLPEPLPVLLLYWTTAIDWDTGEIHFKKDVYGRDKAILESLDGEITVRKRHRPEG
jgi:murein L,D-transpeptidase YcbB/YkuD